MVKETQMKTTLRHKVHIHTGNLLGRPWGSGRSAHGWFKCTLVIFVKSCGEQPAAWKHLSRHTHISTFHSSLHLTDVLSAREMTYELGGPLKYCFNILRS